MKFTSISIGLLASLASINSVHAAASVQDCSLYISKQIINLFQSGLVTSNIEQCEKDGDSGIASGFINFTTANGDALVVIKALAKTEHYDGGFDKYLPILEKYAKSNSGSTKGLDGYCNAWYSAAYYNPDFYKVQLQVANDLYRVPANQYADKLKLKFAVSRAVIYDTAIINGVESDGDSLGGLVQTTNKQFTKAKTGSSGSTLSIDGVKVDEIVWVQKLLDNRLKANGSGDKANVNAYRYIIDQGKYDWKPSVKVPGPNGKINTVTCNAIL